MSDPANLFEDIVQRKQRRHELFPRYDAILIDLDMIECDRGLRKTLFGTGPVSIA